MKYVTEEQVQKEIEFRKKYNGGKEPSLSELINFFCQGAVTTASNKIYDYLDDGAHLVLNSYNWKHDCPMWEIRDSDDDELFVFESFSDLVDNK